MKQARWRGEVVEIIDSGGIYDEIWQKDSQPTKGVAIQFGDGYRAIVPEHALGPIAPLGALSLAPNEIGRLSVAKEEGKLSILK